MSFVFCKIISESKIFKMINSKISGLAGTGNRAVYSTSTGELTNTSSDERVKNFLMFLDNSGIHEIYDYTLKG